MLRDTSDAGVRREAHRWLVRMRGDDAAEHHAAFERWRAADPRRRTVYAQLERQWDQASLLAQTTVGRARSLPERRAIRWGPPLGYAATIALVVLATSLTLWVRAPGVVRGRSAAMTEVASRVGEIRRFRLSDGSRVTLDTDSAVQIAYRPDARQIILTRGRARFNVAHNPPRPFVVLAGTGTVTARGTIFDVSLVAGHVGVTLLRGVVDVRGVGTTRQPERSVVRLQAGQRTDYATREAPEVPRQAAPTDSDWVSGMLSFDANRLGDALAQANRYSSTKISVADPALEELRITGAYRVHDATAFAQSLAASLDLRVTNGPGGAIILARST